MEFDLFKWTGSIWILEQLEKIDPEQPSSRLINGIAKYAIKNEEFYKYVVKTIELFLNKTEIEKYLVVLYVIDSIVQHSRSRSNYKDRYSKYFGINLEQTINIIFQNKTKFRQIVKVLTLWKKKNIFSDQIIDKILLIAINKGARKYFEILGFDEKTIQTKSFQEDITDNNEKESNQTQNIDTISNEDKVITNSEPIEKSNSKLIKNQTQFKSDPLYFDYGEDDDQDENQKNQQLFNKMDSNISSNNFFSTTKAITPISTLTTTNAITPMTTNIAITDIDSVTDIAISPPSSDHINNIQENINLKKRNELIKNPLNKYNNNNENENEPNDLNNFNNMKNKDNNNNDQNLNENFIPNPNNKFNIYNNYNFTNQNTNNNLNENNKKNILEGKYQPEDDVIPKMIEIQNRFPNDPNKNKNHHSKLIDQRSNSLPSNKATPFVKNTVSDFNVKSSTPIPTMLSSFSTSASTSSPRYGNNTDPKIVNNQQLQQNTRTDFNKESKYNQNNNNFNSYPILNQNENEQQKKVDYLSNRTTLYLGNLDQSMSEKTLYTIFGKFGKIINCRYLSYKNIAFLTFETHEQAQNALNQMQSQIIYNKPIKIEWSKNSNRNSNNRMNLQTSQSYNSKINQTIDYNNNNISTNIEQKENGKFSPQQQQMQIQTQPQLPPQTHHHQIQQRPEQYQRNEKRMSQDNYSPLHNNKIPKSSSNYYKENEFEKHTKQYPIKDDYRVNNHNNIETQYQKKHFHQNERNYNSNNNKQQDYKNENFHNNDQYYKNDLNNNYRQKEYKQNEHNNNNNHRYNNNRHHHQDYQNERFHNNDQYYKNDLRNNYHQNEHKHNEPNNNNNNRYNKNDNFHNNSQDYKNENFHNNDQYYKNNFNNNYHQNEHKHNEHKRKYKNNNHNNQYHKNENFHNNSQDYKNESFNNNDRYYQNESFHNNDQYYKKDFNNNHHHEKNIESIMINIMKKS